MAMRYPKPSIPDFRRLRQMVTAEAEAVLVERVGAFAETEAAAFKQALAEQVFPSFRRHPLSRDYFHRKRQLGLDTRVLMATDWYRTHIRVWPWRPFGEARRHVRGWRVGFHPEVLARDHRGRPVPLLLSRLAAIHEHGSAAQHIPARAHWRPWARAMRGRARVVRAQIRAELVRRWRLRGRAF